jgi:hypothetical protein
MTAAGNATTAGNVTNATNMTTGGGGGLEAIFGG